MSAQLKFEDLTPVYMNKLTGQVHTYENWRDKYKASGVDFDRLLERKVFFHLLTPEDL